MSDAFKDSIGHTYLTSTIMPANSKLALRELVDILERNNTNSFKEFSKFSDEDRLHVEANLNFLLAQIFGEFANISIPNHYVEIYNRAKN